MINIKEDISQEIILKYMNYLTEECDLNISIHISEKYFYLKCNGQLLELIPFNCHVNPYCVYVKNILHLYRKCVLCQNMAVRKCTSQASYIGSCHAGVMEYVRRIVVGQEVIGFVSVSGYKGKDGLKGKDTVYEQYLDPGPIPEKFLNTVIPPLCAMLSQYISLIKNVYINETLYSKIQDYLAENHSSVTLDEISRKFSYSKSYISHMFKKESGLTLKAYCNKLKVEDAKRLLFQTNISVTEVAFMVGFNSFSYFINVFKEATGMTPLEYRHERRKESGVTRD